MLRPKAASWISVLRTIACLLRDQLFQPVKTCSSVSTVILLILSTIHPSLHEKLDLHQIYSLQIWCKKVQTKVK